MQPKTYLIVLLLLTAPYLLSVGYFAVTERQPFDGDLTRVSGLSEADYGWNEPQDAYITEYNFPASRDLSAYDRPYDIVVAGDSFSFRSYTSWINRLIEKTGMSVLALQVNGTSINQIIRHPVFQESPPKYFIFESVERRLFDRLELLDIPKRPLVAQSDAPRTWIPTNLERQKLERGSTFAGIEQRFSHAVHVVRVRAKCLINKNNCRVVTTPLLEGTDNLFTSREQTKIALLKKDHSSRRKWDDRRDEALKNLKLLDDYFANAPDTEFMLLVFPDKLSVYAEFIDTGGDAIDSLIPEVAEVVTMPRLDLAFKAAISKGQKDIYLPSNSHSSGWANILAGEIAAEHLKNE